MADPNVINGALALARWQFAASMARIPHWWTRRNRWPSNGAFDAVVDHIRAHAVPERWGRRVFHYYRPGDGYQYWIMDGPEVPTSQVIIVNRAEWPAKKRP